jgi:cell division septum initiation protein DivIVA
MEEQSKSHVAELEREQKEKENLRQRVETLRNQLFAGYEQSKLDIRQDMLVIVGELSQLVGKQDCVSESLLRDMRAGLSLALQAGGAKALGAVGGTTSFDPLKHQAAESVRIGDSVRITSPGIIVKGQRTSDRVLIKAQVSGISEKG